VIVFYTPIDSEWPSGTLEDFFCKAPRNRRSTMGRVVSMITASLFVPVLTISVLPAQGPQKSQGHREWIANSLKEMQKIEVGMTRADLLKVFTTEGGLSTGLNRTYVYRDCSYIKVDVEFEPVGRPSRDADGRVTLVESNEDVIKKISKPYLEWNVLD
jgi:hypothetical protein